METETAYHGRWCSKRAAKINRSNEIVRPEHLAAIRAGSRGSSVHERCKLYFERETNSKCTLLLKLRFILGLYVSLFKHRRQRAEATYMRVKSVQ